MPPTLGQNLSGGWLQNVPPNADAGAQNAALNAVIDRLNAQLQTQVYSDGKTRRMLFGFQKGGFKNGTRDFGIKISQAGVDVTTATAAQLIFTMDMDTWRWFDPSSRNFVNIGLRATNTYGFEMAKPGVNLDDPA